MSRKRMTENYQAFEMPQTTIQKTRRKTMRAVVNNWTRLTPNTIQLEHSHAASDDIVDKALDDVGSVWRHSDNVEHVAVVWIGYSWRASRESTRDKPAKTRWRVFRLTSECGQWLSLGIVDHHDVSVFFNGFRRVSQCHERLVVGERDEHIVRLTSKVS